MTGVFIRKGEIWTQRHTGIMPCDDGGRDWSESLHIENNAKDYQQPSQASRR